MHRPCPDSPPTHFHIPALHAVAEAIGARRSGPDVAGSWPNRAVSPGSAAAPAPLATARPVPVRVRRQ
ncbi:hypothetical protein FM21_33935 [Streptomyces mutabilis]|uniref:Uncharacterized protein n=1 Tax=Streptomyces mutabilis TaxID=67332 RepID=A0A086MQZ9_9ACTN|nr:hypothetical protein FM21_33935 [Streptomyces mutabilis]